MKYAWGASSTVYWPRKLHSVGAPALLAMSMISVCSFHSRRIFL